MKQLKNRYLSSEREVDGIEKEIHRGEIYYIQPTLDACGCEQSGLRPAVIVSNDAGNQHSTVVEVAYLTTGRKKPLPTHARIYGKKWSTVLCEQITTVSKDRVLEYVGKASKDEMTKIDQAIRISLGISKKGERQLNELQIFTSPEFGQVRTVEIDGKPYFVANDVAGALGYSDCPKAIRTHCKGVAEVSTPTNGGKQLVKVIPEGDIYRLVIKSQLPSAERFEVWVFDEVLPTIRQTGIYADLSPELKAIFAHDKKIRAVVEHMEDHDQRLGKLETSMTVDYGQQKSLNDKHHSRAVRVLGGKESQAYKKQTIKDKVFRTIWRDYKDYFGVASYRDTPAARYEEALQYLEVWTPDTNLKLEIQVKNQEV